MTESENFFAYNVEDTGEYKKIDISKNDLVHKLNPEQVILLVREDLRRIFIWKGAKSPVKKRFISSKMARELQADLMEEHNFHHCKIVSIDQGDEMLEFLDAFNLESMEVKDRLPDMRYVRNSEKPKTDVHQPFTEEKEFRINDHLTLKLIRGKTMIFIDDKPFNQCKYLLLNLTQKDFAKFDEIESIDEAFEIYNKIDKIHERAHYLIDPKSEFIGHCSNLQAWYEHGYDLRILHSSLSIPLLKKLAFLGDNQAIIRLKESIATRIASKNFNTIIFYLNEKYFKLFSSEELEVIFEEWLDKDVQFTFMEKRRLWYPLLKEMIERGILRAKQILKKEIISLLKNSKIEAYRYLLQKHFFQLLNLEDLEELYEYIPQNDRLSIQRIETIILKATLTKRKDLKI
jgi:hypothetical protein